VQTPTKLAIFELVEDEQTGELRAKAPQIVEQRLDCNLLVVTASHVVLCQVRPSAHLPLRCAPGGPQALVARGTNLTRKAMGSTSCTARSCPNKQHLRSNRSAPIRARTVIW